MSQASTIDPLDAVLDGVWEDQQRVVAPPRNDPRADDDALDAVWEEHQARAALPPGDVRANPYSDSYGYPADPPPSAVAPMRSGVPATPALPLPTVALLGEGGGPAGLPVLGPSPATVSDPSEEPRLGAGAPDESDARLAAARDLAHGPTRRDLLEHDWRAQQAAATQQATEDQARDLPYLAQVGARGVSALQQGAAETEREWHDLAVNRGKPDIQIGTPAATPVYQPKAPGLIAAAVPGLAGTGSPAAQAALQRAGSGLDPVSAFVADLAAVPPSFLSPSAIVAAVLTHAPTSEMLATFGAPMLAQVERVAGPKVAAAVGAELSSSAHLGTFSGAQAAVQGKGGEEVLGAAGHGALQGLAFGLPGAAAGVIGKGMAESAARKAADAQGFQEAGRAISAEMRNAPVRVDTAGNPVSPSGLSPEGERIQPPAPPDRPEVGATETTEPTPDVSPKSVQDQGVPARPDIDSMNRPAIVAELTDRTLDTKGSTTTLRQRLADARTKEQTDGLRISDEQGQVRPDAVPEQDRPLEGEGQGQAPAPAPAAEGEARAQPPDEQPRELLTEPDADTARLQRVIDDPEGASYRDLREAAQRLDLPSKGSAKTLRERIVEAREASKTEAAPSSGAGTTPGGAETAPGGSRKWFRGVNDTNRAAVDRFYSASREVAGNYAINKPGDRPQMERLKEVPRNPLVVADKAALAETIGYKGDPLAEPLDAPQKFDAMAKRYAQERGHDAIEYQSGTFDQPELHVFGDKSPAAPKPMDQTRTAEQPPAPLKPVDQKADQPGERGVGAVHEAKATTPLTFETAEKLTRDQAVEQAGLRGLPAKGARLKIIGEIVRHDAEVAEKARNEEIERRFAAEERVKERIRTEGEVLPPGYKPRPTSGAYKGASESIPDRSAKLFGKPKEIRGATPEIPARGGLPGVKTPNIGEGMTVADLMVRADENPPAHVASRIDDATPGPTPERNASRYGGGIGKLKEFVRAVPEFELDPAFTVTESGGLRYQDGGRYTFDHPSLLGLRVEGLREGERVGVDLEALKRAKAGQVLVAEPVDTRPSGADVDVGRKGVSGSPAVAAPSHTMAQPATMAGTTKVRVTAPEIVKKMSEVSGVPFRVGHGAFGQRQAAGWFNRHGDVVRQRSANALDVAAHEFGHAIHDRILGWKTMPKGPAKAQLHDMGKQLYGRRVPNGGYVREGVAEYVARRFLGEDVAKAAPEAQAWMESVLAQHPELAKGFGEIGGMFKEWDTQGAPARVASQINRVQRGPIGAMKNAYEKASAVLSRQWWTNDAQPLEAAVARVMAENPGLKLSPDQDPGKLRAALKMGAAGTARHFVMKSAVDPAYAPIGPSLRETLMPVKAHLDDFMVYAYARRAQVLHDRGINPGISRTDADSTVAQYRSPAFDRAVDGITDWSDALMSHLVDAGGLGPDAAKAIRDLNPVYLPLKRFFDENHLGGSGGGGAARGEVNQPAAVKRLKGSGRQILDPAETLVQHAEQVMLLSNKLRVARAIADLAESADGAAWFAEKIPAERVPTEFRLADVQTQLEKMGVDLSGANLDEVMSVFVNQQTHFGKDNIVGLWRDGKREYWELDPGVYRVVTDLDREYLPAVARSLFGPAKRMVQLGATEASPAFAVKNFIRDYATFLVKGEGWLPFKAHKPFMAIMDQLVNGRASTLWRSMGGELSTIMGQDRAATRTFVDEMLAQTPTERAFAVVKHPIDAMRAVIGTFEAAPRIAEFKTVLERAEKKYGKGSRDALLEAFLASKDVTVDFTRSGIVGNLVNSMTAYFNAGIQGTSNVARTFGGAHGGGKAAAAWANAIAGLTVPTLALWWVNKDEDWYKELPKYRRLGFWNFSLDHGKNVISLPKPALLGYAFGSVPEALADAAYTKDARSPAVSEAVYATIMEAVPNSVMPSLLAPAVEAASNRSFFRGRQIVPQHEVESKPPAEQFGQYTTKSAKWIGKAFNISPRLVEHVVSGYTGGAALKAVQAIESLTAHKDRPGEPADMPVIGSLFTRRVAETRSEELFYAALAEAKQKAGGKDATGIDKNRARMFAEAAEQMAEVRKREERGLVEVGFARETRQFIARKAMDRLAQDADATVATSQR